jgi:hypothetical protein
MESRSLREFLAHPEGDLSLVHRCRLVAQADAVAAEAEGGAA